MCCAPGNKALAAGDAAAGLAARAPPPCCWPACSRDRDAALWAGLGAVLGHLFPVWLRFKGGKGVATGYGVLIAAAWPVGLAAGAAWLIVAALLRRSSLAGADLLRAGTFSRLGAGGPRRR